MITVERTFDYGLVNSIMTHPAIYPFISDDGSPSREQFRAPESDCIWYVLAKNDGQIIGLWMAIPLNAVTYEIHTNVLPDHRGKEALDAAKIALEWAWENIPNCQRIVTNIPRFNLPARVFALQSGLSRMGVNPKSFLKEGVLHDVTMLGISRPEGLCQPQP